MFRTGLGSVVTILVLFDCSSYPTENFPNIILCWWSSMEPIQASVGIDHRLGVVIQIFKWF